MSNIATAVNAGSVQNPVTSFHYPVDIRSMVSHIAAFVAVIVDTKAQSYESEIESWIRHADTESHLGKACNVTKDITNTCWSVTISRMEEVDCGGEEHLLIFFHSGTNIYPGSIKLHYSQLSFLENGGRGSVDHQRGQIG